MKTISDKQQLANSRNALKGGVKTKSGKEIVRFNARTHGILANLIAEYEDDFYQQYVDQLFDELQPTSIIETIFVERIALHYLKLFRVTKAETEFMKSCLHPTKRFGDSLFDVMEQGYAPIINPIQIQQLAEIYGRYETTIENRFYRAIKELHNHRSSLS